MWNERDRGHTEGTTTTHSKVWSASRGGDAVYTVGSLGSPVLGAPLLKTRQLLPTSAAPHQTNGKHHRRESPEFVSRRPIIFRQCFSVVTRKKRLQPGCSDSSAALTHPPPLDCHLFQPFQNSLNGEKFPFCGMAPGRFLCSKI